MLLWLLMLCWSVSCLASEQEQWAFKVTPSLYRTTQQADAVDLNVRGEIANHAVWIGQYQQSHEFEQTRAGYEGTFSLPHATIVPSVQWASHGFVGTSLNGQIGDDIYALAGLGRTNLRDYYNLNFDPNDAITLGVGTTALAHSQLNLFTVRDDRLHTGQRITHLVWRFKPDTDHRWTVDISQKSGAPAAGEAIIHGMGVSLAYDMPSCFVKLAKDNKVNFSDSNQTRVALGLRF